MKHPIFAMVALIVAPITGAALSAYLWAIVDDFRLRRLAGTRSLSNLSGGHSVSRRASECREADAS
jgi:hypothetical protein